MPDALGLDAAMHEIYRALVHQGGGTADDVSRSLRLPVAEVQPVLDRLGALGLVITDPHHDAGAASRVVPRDPRESLGPTVQHLEAEVAERQAKVQQARETVAGLTMAYSDRLGHPGLGEAELYHGVEAIRLRVESLLDDASSRVCCFVPASAHEIMLNVGVPNLQRLTDRGVTVRLIFMGSLRNDLIARDHAELLQSIVGTVRTTPALPLPMIVVDGTVTVLPGDDDGVAELDGDREPVAQVVRNRALAVGLGALFKRVWADAEPLATSPLADPTTGLTAAERGLLELLGRGLTDAAAARKLGVSLRTVRRMMSEIMSRLGAHSRFEAGVRAAARGWLDDPTDAGGTTGSAPVSPPTRMGQRPGDTSATTPSHQHVPAAATS